MSTQQDIYAAGPENCPLMLNKENYVPWSSRLLRYTKSRPNGKLIHNSIINGPYVKRMIPKPEDFIKPRNRQIAQSGMNMGQDKQMQMVGVQNQRIQNVGNQNGQIVVPGNANQNSNGNGNLIAARAEGNATRHNGNQIRCYNYRGAGHFARNCIVRPKRMDTLRLTDLDEMEKVNANCILMANLQQALTPGTQTDKAPVYDSDGSAEVHNYENCYDNEIFNMFTQEEQYTELLEPIPEPHQVPQNDNNAIFEVSIVKQSGGTVEQHPANVEETRVLYDSLYNNLAIEVEKVNTVNHKLSETNAELTTELARYKNQEKCFEITKFIGDFKSLAKQADESLAKHKALELEIKRLLRAVFSQDIMSVVQNNSVRETSNLQTELERMFRINPFKPFREEKHVPNKVRASVRTNPLTVSQPPVITKKVVNSDSNGLSSA
nr:hypothetical protein [Tanacetum cinerariifolium]